MLVQILASVIWIFILITEYQFVTELQGATLQHQQTLYHVMYYIREF